MAEIDYGKLRERYGGMYVARRGEDVVMSGRTHDELADQLERAKDLDKLVIEYVEPIDTIAIY